jgi:hypothetical protein
LIRKFLEMTDSELVKRGQAKRGAEEGEYEREDETMQSLVRNRK